MHFVIKHLNKFENVASMLDFEKKFPQKFRNFNFKQKLVY